MSKQNLVLYGAGERTGYFFWQLFQSEHRIWVADKREAIPGASYWQKDLFNKPIDINKSEYRPVNGVVIFKVNNKDILELFNSISQKESINVLLFDCFDDDIIQMIKDVYSTVKITCLKHKMDIQLLEDLYLTKKLVLKGGNTSYWKELLEDGLLNVNVDVESEDGLALQSY